MNLQKLFEAQAELDAFIEQQHPTLPGENRLEKKVLALLVELGECCNEWRGFKFWSNDQEPKTGEEHRCIQCKGDGLVPDFIKFKNNNGNKFKFCPRCGGSGAVSGAVKSKNPLLEEYVDVLHFILSIGNEKVPYFKNQAPIHLELPFGRELEKTLYKDTTTQFVYLFNIIGVFADTLMENEVTLMSEAFDEYAEVLKAFLGLGELLDFTEEQIEEAYWKKYEINKQRQRDGY